MSDANEKLAIARKIAERKVGFVRHAIIYLVVMVGLVIINNLTYGGYQWWLWPAFGWGMGLVSNFISAYVFRSGTLHKRLVEREMEKLDE